jgi:deferrochelatase/peroxidase EfeB
LSSSGDDESAATRQAPVLSRRGLFGLAGAGVVGAGIGFAAHAFAVPHEPSAISGTSEFYGTHQAGIVTAAQDRLHFASFDLAEGTDKDDLISLLKDWTAAAAQMTRGQDAGAHGALGGSPEAPPDDTGEALDLDPAGLTITFGFGPSLFDDRFGLGARRPEALADLPHFSADALRPEWCGGDLCIQACSNDPQIAVHAIRNLSRIAFGRASLRWSQLGFGRTSSTTKDQLTPRNLFGFKDGTANVKVEDTQQVEDHIWARASDGAEWMHGGSYLVARKIRMTIEVWDRQSLREQERVFGRAKGDGAPLSGGTEFSALDFHKSGKDGTPLIDPDSHVHLAHRSSNSGAVLLRRGYNYVDGNDELGRLNAGLFFICFQRDPRTQFVAIQSTLAGRDAMNEYIRHIGSAIFAVPPGVADGSYVGATLFD